MGPGGPPGGPNDMTMWSTYIDLSDWDPNRWEIKGKVNDDLKNHPFDGVMAKYKDWRSHMVNHLLHSNQGWGKVLWIVQQQRLPITYQRLQATRIGGINVNWIWLTRAMYAFMYDHVTLAQKRAMPTRLGTGQEYNGLELWRLLHFENEGGAVEVEILERDCFIGFPECPDPQHLLSRVLVQNIRPAPFKVRPLQHLWLVVVSVV